MNSTSINDYAKIKHSTKSFSQNSITKYREWDFGEISLLILVLFGAVTNSLTIVVMTRKRMRSSNASLYIIFISISDFLVLFFKFLANMIKLYRISIYDLCILIQIVPQAASFISVWLILATSAERTVAVLVPLKVIHLFSRKRSKTIIVAIIFIFTCISSSVSFCIQHSESKPYYCKIRGNLNGTCFKYYSFIFPWIRSAFGSWIPSIFGFIFSFIIINALSKASQVRKSITNQIFVKFRPNSVESQISKSIENTKSMKLEDFKILLMRTRRNSFSSTTDGSLRERSSSWRALSSVYSKQLKERQITIMLLTISISFIVLTLPYSIFELLRKLGFKSNFLKNRLILRYVMFLIDLNHSTNFLLFCLTARRFRNELKFMLREIYLRIFKIK